MPASAGDTDEEEHGSRTEQEDTPKIKRLELLPLGFFMNVELIVRRWMVQELVQGYRREDDANIIAPSPPNLDVEDKCSSNGRHEDCISQHGWEDIRSLASYQRKA